MSQVQRVSREYFEAEFGPIDGTKHTEEIAPMREATPAFLAFPQIHVNRCAGDGCDCHEE